MTAPEVVRAAAPADAPALTAVINAAFAVERFFVDGDRTSVADVLASMATGTFLLAERGKDVVGCVYFEPQGERGYFGLLAVVPAEHGKGLGRSLVTAAEDALRAAGCRAADIRVASPREELPPYYRRLGYAETGTEPFPSGVATKRPCHFIRMSKPLSAAAGRA